jgi:hypothetical protein
MGPFAMLDIYPPALVARYGHEAGVSDAQLAKMRQDFFDTQIKMSQQRAKAAEARIEIARALGEPKVDQAAVTKRVDEQAKAEAEVAKLWLALLQRIHDTLTPEQRTKLDDAREHKAAWAAIGALPWLWGRQGMGPPWMRGGGSGSGRGARGGGRDPGDSSAGFAPEGWDDEDPADELGLGPDPDPSGGARSCEPRGSGGASRHRSGGGSQQPPPWF